MNGHVFIWNYATQKQRDLVLNSSIPECLGLGLEKIGWYNIHLGDHLWSTGNPSGVLTSNIMNDMESMVRNASNLCREFQLSSFGIPYLVVDRDDPYGESVRDGLSRCGWERTYRPSHLRNFGLDLFYWSETKYRAAVAEHTRTTFSTLEKLTYGSVGISPELMTLPSIFSEPSQKAAYMPVKSDMDWNKLAGFDWGKADETNLVFQSASQLEKSNWLKNDMAEWPKPMATSNSSQDMDMIRRWRQEREDRTFRDLQQAQRVLAMESVGSTVSFGSEISFVSTMPPLRPAPPIPDMSELKVEHRVMEVSQTSILSDPGMSRKRTLDLDI